MHWITIKRKLELKIIINYAPFNLFPVSFHVLGHLQDTFQLNTVCLKGISLKMTKILIMQTVSHVTVSFQGRSQCSVW